jgi:subtilisin-like proprotein convertase family protein
MAGLLAWACVPPANVQGVVFASQTYEQFDGLESLVIPDGSSAGISDTRTFSIAAEQLTSLSVTLDLSAQYNGDLYGYLVHDDRIAVLLNRSGSTTSDRFGYSDSGFQVTLSDNPIDPDIHRYRLVSQPGTGLPVTGTWQADGRLVDPDAVVDSDLRLGTLSVFAGCNPNGDWTLYLADLSAGAPSSLNSWRLDVTAVPEPVTAVGVSAALLLLFAGWRRSQRPFRKSYQKLS